MKWDLPGPGQWGSGLQTTPSELYFEARRWSICTPVSVHPWPWPPQVKWFLSQGGTSRAGPRCKWLGGRHLWEAGCGRTGCTRRSGRGLNNSYRCSQGKSHIMGDVKREGAFRGLRETVTAWPRARAGFRSCGTWSLQPGGPLSEWMNM